MASYEEKKKKKTTKMSSFFEEEEDQKDLQSPSHPLPDQPRPSLSSNGCGSPWTISPLHHRSLSPSLLYHCLSTLHRHDGTVLSIAVSNGLLFTGSESDRVRSWKHPDLTEAGHIRTRHGKIRAMLAHDNTLFTSHNDHRVRAWTVSASGPTRLKSKKLATFPSRTHFLSFSKSRTSSSSHRHEDTITCLALYLKEGILYSGSLDRTVKAWRPHRSTESVDCFIAHDGHVNAMVIDQEDGCLFTGSSDGSVKVWSRVYGDESHAVVMVLRCQCSPVNALALGSNSYFLYSGSSDGYVNVWEKEEERYRHGGFLQGHRFAVLCLAVAGRVVVSGSEDTTIRVWRREEEAGVHACVAVMEGHRGPVRCVALWVEVEGGGEGEGEGMLLYSASLDRMVKVWRMKVVGKERGEEEEEEEEVVAGDEMSPVLSPLWVEKKRVQQWRPWH